VLVQDVVEGSRPSIGAGLTLELIQQTDAPPTPRTDGAMLMTGTPRTPRGSIPYETELLREQLEEQLAMTVALREQLEASSVEAAVKQLRENWLLAEDRADQHRARLTDVCLQQVPSLKRELAALSGENTVLRTQVAELMDDLQEATLLGHELVMVTPRQQDFDSVSNSANCSAVHTGSG
jgi:DNA primase